VEAAQYCFVESMFVVSGGKTMKQTAPKTTAAKKPATPKPSKMADWTILIYMAGDNDLDDFGGDDIAEMKKVGSSERLHVIVQRDTAAAGLPVQRYRVRKGTSAEADVVQSIGETNTGDPKVLADFLKWGRLTYPAKRTMAVLWNHGSGWDDTDIYAEAKRRGLNPLDARPASAGGQRRSGARGRPMLPGGFVHRSAARKRYRGPFFLTAFQLVQAGGNRRAIAFDDDAQDFLDSVEMKNVFNAAARAAKRKFDVIGMDACLMSMVETAAQVQQAGEVFCGSQEVEPGAGWPYDRILKALAANPAMDGRELTRVIVKEFVASYPKTEAVTQSAFDLTALAQVQKAADGLGTLLAKALKKQDMALEGSVSVARRMAQGYEHPDYVDLCDFSAHLSARWPASVQAAKKVQEAVTACVFANSAPNAQVKASRGLSIYLPLGKVSPLYKLLDFAKGGWAGFLAARVR
jgi:hypothetical protein